MNSDTYQEWSQTTAIYPPETALEYLAMGLTSEAGEVAGKIKKKVRDGKFDEVATADELGDVLWYVARLADELGYTMSDLFQLNHDKLMDRKERDVLGGSGDKR